LYQGKIKKAYDLFYHSQAQSVNITGFKPGAVTLYLAVLTGYFEEAIDTHVGFSYK